MPSPCTRVTLGCVVHSLRSGATWEVKDSSIVYDQEENRVFFAASKVSFNMVLTCGIFTNMC